MIYKNRKYLTEFFSWLYMSVLHPGCKLFFFILSLSLCFFEPLYDLARKCQRRGFLAYCNL